MTPDPTPPHSHPQLAAPGLLAPSHYGRLGLHPSASAADIRRAYRELSKCYHPDTTELAPEVATAKFQQLNEAYATLSNPERRRLYDAQIGYSRLPVLPVMTTPPGPVAPVRRDSAYLDPTDRPLSAGEIFALFALGVSFLLCLLLAVGVALWRGDPLGPAGNLGAIALKLTVNLLTHPAPPL